MTWEELGLEKPCEGCNGTTMKTMESYAGSPRQVYCPDCNATGVVPSELGEELIKFIKRNIKGEVKW